MHSKYRILLIALFCIGVKGAFASDIQAPSKPNKCITIQGTLSYWNGWPPYWRIETFDHKNVFGLESAFDGDNVPKDRSPENLKQEIDKGIKNNILQFDGKFVFCLTSKVAKVPYDKRPIKLGWIKAYQSLP
jgi:hypothetical protein